MPVDISSVDLKGVFEQHGFTMYGRKPTRVWTGDEAGEDEYNGSCPWCGGENRFMFRTPRGRYSCAIRSSGCGRYGNDILDFIQEYEEINFTEACQMLGVDPGSEYQPGTRKTHVSHSRLVQPPCKRWQETAQSFVDRAALYLKNSKRAAKVLEYLHKRGMTDEIIDRYHIGYIPLDERGRWYRGELEDWGLDPADYPTKDGETVYVYLPEGILIPWYCNGDLWKLNVRRLSTIGPNDAKYLPVLGSKDGLFNVDAIDTDKPAVPCESELDALSGVVSGVPAVFVATGGTTKARYPQWIARISAAPCVLVAYDDDENEAGDKGAGYWLETLPNAIRWLPWTHDINDMLTQGIDIGAWLTTGVAVAEHVLAAKSATRTELLEASPARGDEAMPVVTGPGEPDAPDQVSEQTTEEAFECEDCHTPVPNPIPEGQIDNPRYCFNVVYDANNLPHCYCEYCRDANGMPVPKPPMTREQFMQAGGRIADVWPGGCQIEELQCSASEYIAQRCAEIDALAQRNRQEEAEHIRAIRQEMRERRYANVRRAS